MGREKGIGSPYRVGVIGAGPAGTFFALHLHNLGKKYGKNYSITLFDRKVFDMVGPGGCNMCAGAIGYITYEKIKGTGIEIQEAVVRRIAEGYVFHGKMRNAQIIHPQRRGIYTVFRGGGPIIEDEHSYKSFDQFLLDCCIERGMSFINERVKNVQGRADGPEKTFLVSTPEGVEYEFDFLVGAFGVNSPISRTFIPGYKPPETWHTCQAELKVDPNYITDVLKNMIHLFSTEDKRIMFIAITPKDEYLTISAIGEYVKISYLKEELEKNERLKSFLPENYELICHCHPQAPVGCAINPIDNGVAVVGDAFVSRYLKNGIDSALDTSKVLAETIVKNGTSREALENNFYKKCIEAYHSDNRWGKLLFALYATILRRGYLSDLYIGSVQQEGEDASIDSARLTRILWGVFAGDQPYREIMHEAFTFSTFFSLAKNIISF